MSDSVLVSLLVVGSFLKGIGLYLLFVYFIENTANMAKRVIRSDHENDKG
jgi:hypothetical protein